MLNHMSERLQSTANLSLPLDHVVGLFGSELPLQEKNSIEFGTKILDLAIARATSQVSVTLSEFYTFLNVWEIFLASNNSKILHSGSSATLTNMCVFISFSKYDLFPIDRKSKSYFPKCSKTWILAGQCSLELWHLDY